jgi:hypothetical protein
VIRFYHLGQRRRNQMIAAADARYRITFIERLTWAGQLLLN